MRLAIEQGAHLVPVLALGEGLQLRNLFDLPRLQQLTCKKVGARGGRGGFGRLGGMPLSCTSCRGTLLAPLLIFVRCMSPALTPTPASL